jgi:hypothetical protein
MIVNRSRAIALIIVICLVVGGLSWSNYTHSFSHLTISWVNVDKVEVLSLGGTTTPVTTAAQSGSVLKIPKGSYYLHYIGAPGYEEAYRSVNLTSGHQSVSFSPGYSSQHLDSLRLQAMPAITAALVSTFPNLAQYKVSTGQLYSGDDFFNNDTLRLVAHYSNGSWTITTTPPDIILSKLVYPLIPSDVIENVNLLK